MTQAMPTDPAAQHPGNSRATRTGPARGGLELPYGMAVNTTVQVTLPAMGESVREGTVLEWHKREGDLVAADETIVEISTDKVDAEVPAPISGTLLKFHAAEGDTVAVGAVLAEIAPGDGAPPPPLGDADPPAAEPVDGDINGGPAPVIIDIVTPGGGESVTEGTILE
ncbi:MAG: hypothetical protein QOG42_670, partial [Solirubrobacteraceae bacterium]|nr:hypothetical protein [Solirubrobacteraceae bacterium]